MQLIKSISVAATALATLTSAAPAIHKRGVVAVELEQADNSVVKATLKNTGSEEVALLKYGTILDDAVHTRKLAVVKDGKDVEFEGVLLNYHLKSLPESAFVKLAAGESITKDIQVAETHDLSEGGAFEIAAVGAIPVAQAGSTELSDEAFVFESNTLNLDVDGAEAAKVEPIARQLAKRTAIQTSSCSTSQLSALRTALSNSASLSSAAATAATSGNAAKFNEYFKTTATATRSTVAARFRGVVSQSGSATGTRYYCSDFYGACSSNVLAYTLPSTNQIANCPLYYSALPGLTRTCHAQDQATTSLHEFTHAPATYSPGTQDNGYGYAAATALSSARAVLNADSYALYANAIYVGC